MTTIHEFAVSEGQEWVLPVDDSFYEEFFSLDGRSAGASDTIQKHFRKTPEIVQA